VSENGDASKPSNSLAQEPAAQHHPLFQRQYTSLRQFGATAFNHFLMPANDKRCQYWHLLSLAGIECAGQQVGIHNTGLHLSNLQNPVFNWLEAKSKRAGGKPPALLLLKLIVLKLSISLLQACC
jgi:hypothetical protein